ncbi:MAG: hypothetical protein P8M25_12480, partial [Paracoccaceae bacterium]|nr:hypothetical protein [Paracoccaceae bacterium]
QNDHGKRSLQGTSPGKSWRAYLRNITILLAGLSTDASVGDAADFLYAGAVWFQHVKDTEAQKLEVWLTSKRAKKLINGYQLGGEALFTFNAE